MRKFNIDNFRKVNLKELFFPVLVDVFKLESFSDYNSIAKNNHKLANNEEAYLKIKKLISIDNNADDDSDNINKTELGNKEFIAFK